MEALERLKGQIQVVGQSIAKAVGNRTLIQKKLNHETHPFPLGNVYP